MNMKNSDDPEDYWNTSANKSFSFDECDDVSILIFQISILLFCW